jgi:DNA-binding CsgD family transcriptional regulator
MALRWRYMQQKDVHKGVEIVAMQAVLSARYGPAITDLPAAWLQLLGCDAFTAIVLEDVDGSQPVVFGVCVGVFVTDAFIREVKTPPLFWFGPELASRIVRRESPVLSNPEVRNANSSGGLNLLVWEATRHTGFVNRSDAFHLMTDAYFEVYRGFLLREMIATQTTSLEQLHRAVDAGGLLWNPTEGCYTRSTIGASFTEPHVVGLTRDLELERPGSLIGRLFYYHPPRFGFSRSEQRLLILALTGATDVELAEQLGVSPSCVKKLWLSIYRRASLDSTKDSLQPDDTPGERGREKKRRLLYYVRERPEELRPVNKHATARASQPALVKAYTPVGDDRG